MFVTVFNFCYKYWLKHYVFCICSTNVLLFCLQFLVSLKNSGSNVTFCVPFICPVARLHFLLIFLGALQPKYNSSTFKLIYKAMAMFERRWLNYFMHLYIFHLFFVHCVDFSVWHVPTSIIYYFDFCFCHCSNFH